MLRQYPAFIHKDPGSDYGVSFPDFPGCVTAGSTMEEAYELAQEALQFHIDGMLDDGDQIPEPSVLEEARESIPQAAAVSIMFVPARAPAKAKRVNITIDERLLKAIDRAAAQLSMSRSAFLAEGARALMEKQPKKRPRKQLPKSSKQTKGRPKKGAGKLGSRKSKPKASKAASRARSSVPVS